MDSPKFHACRRVVELEGKLGLSKDAPAGEVDTPAAAEVAKTSPASKTPIADSPADKSHKKSRELYVAAGVEAAEQEVEAA